MVFPVLRDTVSRYKISLAERSIYENLVERRYIKSERTGPVVGSDLWKSKASLMEMLLNLSLDALLFRILF